MGVGVGVLPRVGVGVFVGVTDGVGVGVTVPPVNLNQFRLNKYPVPLPVNLRYKLCTPVTPLTVQVLVAQVCQPPVPATVQVPTNEPLVPSSLISILPPLVALATLA